MTRKCRHCKSTFKIKRINQYYCSQSCRQKAYLFRNGFSKEKSETEKPPAEDVIKNLAGLVNPELMQGIISLLNGKASMTDFYEKKPDKPSSDTEKKADQPEESVNDAKPKKKFSMQEFYRKRMIKKQNPDEKSAFMEAKKENVVQKPASMEQKNVIIEDSYGSHGVFMEKKNAVIGDSWGNYAGVMRGSCDNHVCSMGNSYKNLAELPINASKPGQKDVFSYMVEQKLTIPIAPKGFVRSLFPQWNDKEWKISCLVNDRFLTVMDRLKKGSMKERIKTAILHDCMKELTEITDGVSGIMLPLDYPFTKFISYIKSRLVAVIQNAGKKEVIKFRISKELEYQISILFVQLNQKSDY